MDELKVGQCVTFADAKHKPEHIGLIISLNKIMGLDVAEVLWEDGNSMVCNIESLQKL